MSDRIIDIEVEVESIAPEEMDTAAGLVAKVVAERERWLRAWHETVMQPELLRWHDADVNSRFVAPGSGWLQSGERVLGWFKVRYHEGLGDVRIEADWPGDGGKVES